MFEYKVLNLLPTEDGKYSFVDALKLHSSVRTEYLEYLLNDYAQQGWRVVSLVPVFLNLMGFSGGERLLVTLEREVSLASQPIGQES